MSYVMGIEASTNAGINRRENKRPRLHFSYVYSKCLRSHLAASLVEINGSELNAEL